MHRGVKRVPLRALAEHTDVSWMNVFYGLDPMGAWHVDLIKIVIWTRPNTAVSLASMGH